MFIVSVIVFHMLTYKYTKCYNILKHLHNGIDVSLFFFQGNVLLGISVLLILNLKPYNDIRPKCCETNNL